MLSLETADGSPEAPESIDYEALGGIIGDFIGSSGIYTGDAKVALSFVSDEAMRELNLKYRGVDSSTDVLSFPLWEEGGVFAPPEGWEVLPLGDVVISPEYVRENAEKNDLGTGKADKEFILMIVHGTLHLVGYDHDTDERRAEMWRIQDGLVEKYFKKS